MTRAGQLLAIVKRRSRKGTTVEQAAELLPASYHWAERVMRELMRLGSVRRVRIRKDGRLTWLYLPAG